MNYCSHQSSNLDCSCVKWICFLVFGCLFFSLFCCCFRAAGTSDVMVLLAGFPHFQFYKETAVSTHFSLALGNSTATVKAPFNGLWTKVLHINIRHGKVWENRWGKQNLFLLIYWPREWTVIIVFCWKCQGVLRLSMVNRSVLNGECWHAEAVVGYHETRHPACVIGWTHMWLHLLVLNCKQGPERIRKVSVTMPNNLGSW